MNLNNLKPAWRQFQFLNSMERMDREEILFMLDKAEGMAIRKTNRLVMHAMTFLVLTCCCQGG
jgi:hypothetical protein